MGQRNFSTTGWKGRGSFGTWGKHYLWTDTNGAMVLARKADENTGNVAVNKRTLDDFTKFSTIRGVWLHFGKDNNELVTVEELIARATLKGDGGKAYYLVPQGKAETETETETERPFQQPHLALARYLSPNCGDILVGTLAKKCDIPLRLELHEGQVRIIP